MIAVPHARHPPGYLATPEGATSAVALALITVVFGLLFTSVALYLQRKERERQAERQAHRADAAAIDPGGPDADEEPTVESGVALGFIKFLG